MECFKTITATGTGFWGAHYTVELFTMTRVYQSRRGQSTREIITYGFRYRPLSAATWEVDKVDNSERLFESEAARAAFLARNFTDLRLDLVPTPSAVVPCWFDLSPVAGEPVNAVTFWADFLQLTINEHFFEFYLWPTVHLGKKSYGRNDEGYCDAFCSLIGHVVRHIEEFYDVGLVLDFEDGSVLECPLHDTNPTGEIAEYRGPNEMRFTWWNNEPAYR